MTSCVQETGHASLNLRTLNTTDIYLDFFVIVQILFKKKRKKFSFFFYFYKKINAVNQFD